MIFCKDTDVDSEQEHLILLDGKSDICMDNNGKDTKHTRYIPRWIHFVRSGKEWTLPQAVWCEGGLKLSDIVTKNVREDEFNYILRYAMVTLDSWQNTCTRGVLDT